MKAPYPCLEIGPVRVSHLKREDALKVILAALKQRQKLSISFANTNLINWAHRQPPLRQALSHSLILNDGVGVQIMAWLLHGKAFPHNLNGTDLILEILKKLPTSSKVYLYGGEPIAVFRAARYLMHQGIKIVGKQNGYSNKISASLVKEMNASKADVVLVALGNPQQELWISKQRSKVKAPLCLAVGALFDFWAGKFPRAPKWIRQCRLEWLYRLWHEPRRLGRRYTIDIFFFIYVCVRWKIQGAL